MWQGYRSWVNRPGKVRKTIYCKRNWLSRRCNHFLCQPVQNTKEELDLQCQTPSTLEQYEPAACWRTIGLIHNPFLLPENLLTVPWNLFVTMRERKIKPVRHNERWRRTKTGMQSATLILWQVSWSFWQRCPLAQLEVWFTLPLFILKHIVLLVSKLVKKNKIKITNKKVQCVRFNGIYRHHCVVSLDEPFVSGTPTIAVNTLGQTDTFLTRGRN